MKQRKPIARSTVPLKRTRLARGRKPIAQMSARRLSEAERRIKVCDRVWTRAGAACEAGAAHDLVGVPCHGALEVNEIVPRAQWAKGYLVVENCQLLCHDFHAWVTTHPAGAHALGFRRWSWERSA